MPLIQTTTGQKSVLIIEVSSLLQGLESVKHSIGLAKDALFIEGVSLYLPFYVNVGSSQCGQVAADTV